MEMLLLAVSSMPHGSCIAGVDQSGKWVRPVVNDAGLPIPWDQIVIIDELGVSRNLQPMDVIDIQFHREVKRPDGFHIEDQIYVSWSIRFLRKFTGAPPVDPSPCWFMKNNATFVDRSMFTPNGVRRQSLSAVRASLVTVDSVEDKIDAKLPKVKISFFAYGIRFSGISLTDLRRMEIADALSRHKEAVICMSLGQNYTNEWMPDGEIRNYKLAAGLIFVI